MKNPGDFLGRPVASLQAMLRTLDRAEGRRPAVFLTGVYDDATAAAVAAFQRRSGLPPTGRADHATWNRLADAWHAKRFLTLPAEPLAPVWEPGQAIRPGERNSHLWLVQGMLLALRERFPSLPAPDATGVHDEKSVQAVRWLQGLCGLPVTGEIDARLWARLARLYRAAAGSGRPPG